MIIYNLPEKQSHFYTNTNTHWNNRKYIINSDNHHHVVNHLQSNTTKLHINIPVQTSIANHSPKKKIQKNHHLIYVTHTVLKKTYK